MLRLRGGCGINRHYGKWEVRFDLQKRTMQKYSA